MHPANPDIVFVSALGHPYGPNEERGVFRSNDGGKTWKKVLYRGDRVGAVDLCLDPHDPNVLYRRHVGRLSDPVDAERRWSRQRLVQID